MAVIELIGNNASGLDARTIINQVITATNEELVSSVTYSAGVLTVSYKDGTTQTYTITSSGGGGDMFASIYDPAGIEQQLVGLTATQTLTNKTLTDVATNKINARSVAVYVKATSAFADSLIPRPFRITGNEGADAAFLVTPLTDNTVPANGIIIGALSLNAYGIGYTNGKVYNVNTDAWNVNDILWLQTNGQLGTTRPSTGYQQPIAQVVRKNANNGILHVVAGYPVPDAADVRFTPAGNIAATNVQAALQELDTEKAATSHTHDASAVISGTFADARISQSSVTQHQAALSITESQISDLSHDADLIKGVNIDATVATPSDGDILVYRTAGSDWVLEAKPAGGSNPALNDVTDVTITTPADNEVLAYDTASGDWINQTASEAGLATAAQGALADTALQPAAIGVSVQAHSAILDATTASFTTADETKLDGIEAGADVTDFTNVQAAGALMDSEVTNLAAVKAFDPTDYATAAQGVLAEKCEIGVACSDETTDLTTGTAKVTFRMPYAMTLTGVRANVNTAPVGSTITVDINEGGVSVLSTLLTIDAAEKTSTTAAVPAVISDSGLADDAEITIDIDQVGSTTAGKGLKVWLIGTRA